MASTYQPKRNVVAPKPRSAPKTLTFSAAPKLAGPLPKDSALLKDAAEDLDNEEVQSLKRTFTYASDEDRATIEKAYGDYKAKAVAQQAAELADAEKAEAEFAQLEQAIKPWGGGLLEDMRSRDASFDKAIDNILNKPAIDLLFGTSGNYNDIVKAYQEQGKFNPYPALGMMQEFNKKYDLGLTAEQMAKGITAFGDAHKKRWGVGFGPSSNNLAIAMSSLSSAGATTDDYGSSPGMAKMWAENSPKLAQWDQDAIDYATKVGESFTGDILARRKWVEETNAASRKAAKKGGGLKGFVKGFVSSPVFSVMSAFVAPGLASSIGTTLGTGAVASGALAGAAIGGGAAAITGGDIGKGLLGGAVGGAVSGALGGGVSDISGLPANQVAALGTPSFSDSLIGSFKNIATADGLKELAFKVGASAAKQYIMSGQVNVKGLGISAVSGVFGKAFGDAAKASNLLGDSTLGNAGEAAIGGAVGGGVGAALSGGNVGTGALAGGASAGAGNLAGNLVSGVTDSKTIINGVVGGVQGGVSSAITGGNVGNAVLAGAGGGVISGGLQDLGWAGSGVANAVGGAAGGLINSELQDPSKPPVSTTPPGNSANTPAAKNWKFNNVGFSSVLPQQFQRAQRVTSWGNNRSRGV